MLSPSNVSNVTREQENEVDSGSEEDWKLAKRGIVLVLNNRFDEAYECFQERGQSIQLAAGHCYVTFLAALMTFEENMINQAFTVLRDLEKRCAQNLGWLKSMKSKMSGEGKQKEELFEEHIMLADCQVCLAFLNGLVNDSASSYVKSGWALRKAWRIYQSTYNDLLKVYKRTFGVASLPGTGTSPWRLVLQHGITPDSPTCPWTFPPGPSTPSSNGYVSTFWNLFTSSAPSTPDLGLSRTEVNRLMGAVSFGFGLFHLMVSLLPPSMLKLMQLLGFSGDRSNGIDALMFARLGTDMRAPLATLALLWYHTIVRPFYAVDGHNICAGAEAANLLILETKDDFTQSSIFLFFKGRIHRLKNDIEKAVEVYYEACSLTQQRELHLLCLHEIAWCRLIQLDFDQACATFTELMHQSKWGTVFYKYCTMICCGAAGKAVVLARERSGTGPRNKELEVMIMKRLSVHFTRPHSPFYNRLLGYELLYMWNNMPASKYTALIITDCEENVSEEEPMLGLRLLSLGVCLSVRDNAERAEECFHEVLRIRKGLPTTAPDAHIDVFTYYELACIKLRSPETLKEAQTYLQRINVYRDYDLEHQLSFRIHAAMKQAHM